MGGLIAALQIRATPPQGSNKKMNMLFIREIYYTLKSCRATPHLLPSIFGSAFFLFIGGFTQLNIIPFAIQSLNLSEVFGGYLFLATALGIALGAFLAGKASRKRVELGLPCLSGFGIALFFLLLKLFSHNLYVVILCLFVIGVLGGTFIVPFDTFIQLNTSQVKRGQTIGATNFLSFAGVLIASFALYLFNQVFGFSAATSFAVLSIVMILAALFFTLSLSEFTFSYFARKCLKPLCRYSHPSDDALEKAKYSILVLEKFTWKKALLLSATFPNTHYFLATDSKKWHWFLSFLSNVHPIRPNTPLSATTQLLESFIDQGRTPCLLLEGTVPFESQAASRGFFDFFKKSRVQISFAHLIYEKEKNTRTYLFVKKEELAGY